MKKLASYGLVVVIGCFALAVPAQAANDPRVTLRATPTVVYSGEEVVLTGRATTACTWALRWNGEHRTATGRTISATFTAPAVTRVTKLRATGRCFYASIPKAPESAPPVGASQRIVVAVPPSRTGTVTVTVLPAGSAVNPPAVDGGDSLPSTGGPERWLLLTGLGAVLLGSIAVRRGSPRT